MTWRQTLCGFGPILSDVHCSALSRVLLDVGSRTRQGQATRLAGLKTPLLVLTAGIMCADDQLCGLCLSLEMRSMSRGKSRVSDGIVDAGWK